jgi:AmiR/NasT family two-component response regulator
MTRELRIIVADDEADMREFYQSMLPLLGHKVVAAAASGGELVQRCKTLHPDLIVTDIRMPDMDGIEAVARICKDEPLPVILVSAFQDNQLLERAQAEHIMGYLIKPIEQSDLAPAITIAMSRFEQFHMLRKEAADLRQALQDRKMIERAKGIIMKVASIDEQEAFRRLQRMASDRNRRLVEVAEMVLVAEEMVRPPTER